ncbi:restriction endonuclease subunit S [Staphylococcus hominis]|uniref:restriction endonuclease subunit S n=1 Tax=Staphylococcus hominis TaxID=1290 RepID=UPI003CFC5EBE
MMRLSDREWKVFKIKEVFDIVNLKPEHKVNLKSSGTTPYVTRTEKNNGVENFYKGLHIKKGNCITFGAETAKFYYQEHNFINGNKLYAIYNKSLNKYTALFLTTLFNNQFLDYGYGFGLTGARFSNKKIKLPTLNKRPDYNFMEDYIKEKYFNLKSQIKEKQKHEITDWRGLDEVEWEDYFIESLFQIKPGKRLTKKEFTKGGKPFIGSSDHNNGVTNFVDNHNSSEDFNVLGVNYNGSVVENFYHPYKALFSDDVKRLSLKINGNKYMYLFIKNMILKQKEKYQYGYKFNGTRMKRQIIKLPTKSNQPDYDFMEQYMKRKENEVLERI